MKKKTMKATMALTMASMMSVSMVPAYALASSEFDNVEFDNVKFDQFVIFDHKAGEAAPTADFTYTVTNVTKPDASGMTKAPLVTNATSSDTAITSVATGDNITISAGEAYSKTEVNLDLTHFEFDKIGIYTFTVEGSTSTKDVAMTDNEKTLEVEVAYKVDNNNKPTDELVIMGTALKDEDGNKSKDMSAILTTYYELTLTKKVEGNQADTEHYFQFELTFDGPSFVGEADFNNASPTLSSSIESIDWNENDKQSAIDNNALDIEIGGYKQVSPSIEANNSSNTVRYYLKDGQTVRLSGIPSTVSYTITEIAAEEYETTWTREGNTGSSASVSGADDKTVDAVELGKTNDDVIVVNTKNGTLQTGVATKVAPFASLLAVVTAGIGAIVLGKRRKEDR